MTLNPEARTMPQWATTVYDIFKDIDSHPGYRRRDSFKEIEEPEFWSVYEKFKPYSLCGVQKFYNVFCAIRYFAQHYPDQPGSIVECGVFFGGIMGAMIEWTSFFNLKNKNLWLCDTFEGFTVAGSQSLDLHGQIVKFQTHPNFLKIVETTIALATNNVGNSVRYLCGAVEETLTSGVATEMGDLYLLRLDTDYYESTRRELDVLYPKLVNGGLLIIDDYGHFKGAREATDEYMREHNIMPCWNRVDYSCWSAMKI
jgi:hypothetical protein